VTDFPGEHPEPTRDLENSEPLLAELSIGAILSRLHNRRRSPLFFGRTGGNRFDSPDRSYGVLYAGLDEYCSFVETYGQTTGIRTVTSTALEGRHLAHLELLRPMKLIDLSNSEGLARAGADSRLFRSSHAVAQRWSDAFREHPTRRHPLSCATRCSKKRLRDLRMSPFRLQIACEGLAPRTSTRRFARSNP
jgi:hypothetical protein